jgi:hypothetical protein
MDITVVNIFEQIYRRKDKNQDFLEISQNEQAYIQTGQRSGCLEQEGIGNFASGPLGRLMSFNVNIIHMVTRILPLRKKS